MDDLEVREAQAQKTGTIYASHSVKITLTDETDVFSVGDVTVLLGHLRAFFAFVRGQSIGMSTVTAFNSHTQQKMIVRWGMEHVQPFTNRGMLLSPIHTGSAIAEMFAGYFDSVSRPEGQVILQAIDCYLGAKETSYILSVPIIQAALEGLVGMSIYPSRWRNLGGFKAALETELCNRSIPVGIPHELKNLAKFASGLQLANGPDAFVKARNLIIHAVQGQRDPMALYEAAELGAWYVEMLLLARFGYSGKYRNRLIRDHTQSQYGLVPWQSP
jgi:hypothetical protein